MFMWVKKVIRVREWSDYDRSKGFLEYVKSLFTNLFSLRNWDEHPPKEFSKVVEQYHLQKDDLNKRALIFKRLSLIFLMLFLAICGYAGYMFYLGSPFIGFVVICMSLIALCLAFRYHFYLTLLQHKRLNLTLRDWVELVFQRKLS